MLGDISYDNAPLQSEGKQSIHSLTHRWAIMEMMLLVRGHEVHKGSIARQRRKKKENMTVEPG